LQLTLMSRLIINLLMVAAIGLVLVATYDLHIAAKRAEAYLAGLRCDIWSHRQGGWGWLSSQVLKRPTHREADAMTQYQQGEKLIYDNTYPVLFEKRQDATLAVVSEDGCHFFARWDMLRRNRGVPHAADA
jgi:hypothetical protein